MRPAAVIFDFNGTISDDEGLLAELFERIFGEVGIEVPASLYFEQFAGYADDEICRLVLERFGRSGEPGLLQHLVERRAQLYMEAQRTRSTVHPQAADCVRQIAARVPVAIASGAARVEIEARARVERPARSCSRCWSASRTCSAASPTRRAT